MATVKHETDFDRSLKSGIQYIFTLDQKPSSVTTEGTFIKEVTYAGKCWFIIRMDEDNPHEDLWINPDKVIQIALVLEYKDDEDDEDDGC